MTCLDTDAADKLADDTRTPELFELLETGEVVEVFRLRFDRSGRTARQAAETSGAIAGRRLAGFHRHVGQDGD